MGKCFVIQPFDGGKFDKRYEDVIKPAIEKAGLEPYRVDKDPSVLIPIDEIEGNIRDAVMCVAEITLDNPNVWYEVGYAFAVGKRVILLCAKERPTAFPFDVRHRTITTYDHESPSDFAKLGSTIVSRIEALLAKPEPVQPQSNNASLDLIDGLTGYEVILLKCVMESILEPYGRIYTSQLREMMQQKGINNVGYIISLDALTENGFVSQKDFKIRTEWKGAIGIESSGYSWLRRNSHLLNFDHQPIMCTVEISEEELDPFADD